MIQRIKEYIRKRDSFRWKLRFVKMFYVRKRYGLKHVHPTFYLGGKGDIASDFVAGPYSFLGKGACICPRVKIGAYAVLSSDVSIQGGDHQYDIPGVPVYFSPRPRMPETIIEEDVWVGHRVIIISGVHIGRGAIVGAGAVVTRDVDPYTIVGGVPARLIGRRFLNHEEEKVHDEMLDSMPLKRFTLPCIRVPGSSAN